MDGLLGKEDLLYKENLKKRRLLSITPFNLIFLVKERLMEKGKYYDYDVIESTLIEIKSRRKVLVKEEHIDILQTVMSIETNIDKWNLEEDTELSVYIYSEGKKEIEN